MIFIIPPSSACSAAFMRGRSAFTLLEILVVVGIVCLLAAILFPVLGRVKATGRRTTCASNLRQLSVALNQYAQDHRSFYPLINIEPYSSTSGGCAPWADAVYSYLKTPQVFECPSYKLGAYQPGCPSNDNSNPDEIVRFDGSYSLNILNAYRTVKDDGVVTMGGIFRPQSTNRYTRPSSTILLLDGDGSFVSPLEYKGMFDSYPAAEDVATLEKYGVPNRHEGGVNVAFADGHVKWMKMESLLKKSLWRINGPE